MRIMRVVLVIALAAIGVYGQRVTCDLGSDKAPVIRGLRLGMPEAEAEKLLGGGRKFSLNENLTSSVHALWIDAQPEVFAGIRSLWLESYEGKVFGMNLSYKDDLRWANIKELAENFGPKLGVPNAWEYGITGRDAAMKCKGFEVRLQYIGMVELKLIDNDVDARSEKAYRDQIEAKKKAIKP